MKVLKDLLKNYNLLYIEDEKGIRDQYEDFFKTIFNNVYVSDTAEEGYELYLKTNPDIIILDIRLPGDSGIDFAKKLRKEDVVTRMMITSAYTDPKYTVKAVGLDISEYLVKPVLLDDLLSAFKKCSKELERLRPDFVKLGESIYYNRSMKQIINGDKIEALTNKESRILELLINKKGSVVTYEVFEDGVWEYDYMSKATLRAHVKSLRKKLPENLLKSVKGIGYTIFL